MASLSTTAARLGWRGCRCDHGAAHLNPTCPAPPSVCSKEEFQEVQQELAQVLLSVGAEKQANSVLRSEGVQDGFYKVGGAWMRMGGLEGALGLLSRVRVLHAAAQPAQSRML